LLPRRSLGEFGVAFAGAHNGAEYREAQAASGVKVEGSEWNMELTYLARLSSWLAVKLDLQHVINPNTNPALKNATAFGLRLQIAF
jgi:carbohydrate-selective porin OprB